MKNGKLSFSQGEIIFARFPYEEDKRRKKERPCLVLGVDVEGQRVLAAKLTTTELKRSWAIHIRAGTDDMCSGTIQRESWINLNRREWIPFSDCVFSIGVIRKEILHEIIEKLTLRY